MRALCIPPCMDCARCVQGESKQQQQQQEGVQLREGRGRMGETVVEVDGGEGRRAAFLSKRHSLDVTDECTESLSLCERALVTNCLRMGW